MIEVNGWARVVFAENETEDLLKLKNLLYHLDRYDNQKAEINQFNGSISIHIEGNHNHNNGYTDDIINFLKNLGETATYSYALVYVRLPDDPDLHDQFQVYKLAKGTVTIENDIFLSPCRSVIED